MTAINRPARQRLGTALLMGAAGAAGWLVTLQIAEPPAQPAAESAVAVGAPAATAASDVTRVQTAAAAPQYFQRVGQVISASPNSMTTVNADGESTTFRITPDTTRIGQPTANGTVTVVGVVQNGIPVATAIADSASVGPDGPPMDYQLPT